MDTFCVLPWYGLNLPSMTPCCLLPKNTNITQVKHDLLAGIKSPACAKCWQVESIGQKSKRQFENKFLDYKLDRDLDKIQEDCKTKTINPLVYQIQTSNLCNQACVTCSSYLSSKWAEIERKMGTVPHLTFKIKLSDVNIDYTTARHIEFVGGEPFFDPATFQILNLLIEHNNTDCFISVVTNGSILLNDYQLDILSKFTDLNICISVDGIGPVFEYLRWPAKWNVVCNNIKKFQQITNNISISYTISSLNILYYQQTVDWFNAEKLRYNHNIVSFPTWLSLDTMPIKIKKLLVNNSFAKLWIPENGNEISLKDYYIKIQQQDRAKKIDIKNYLPELAIIFDTLIDEPQ
jgi:sulfatase maturation enzyme AslB (radical SAM superfamily)